jgi:hypothetical protein
MFLCVPITVIAMIICSYFPNTRPIAVLLSGNGKVASATAAQEGRGEGYKDEPEFL